jgi:superfamily I DNA and/or RNA helicase
VLNGPLPSDPVAALERLTALWQLERLATRHKEQALREGMPFARRVERGLSLDRLRYDNTEAIHGGRCQLWFLLEREGQLERAKVNVGDNVVLWTASGAERQSGVVGRRGRTRISVVVDADYASFVERAEVRLDLEPSEVTFDRGDAALRNFCERPELAAQRELFFGTAEPEFGEPEEVTFRDESLNDSQREAVCRALSARQVSLIHGPPGTGKTRTLVEVVRQLLLRGRAILVSAASNTAVDHLTRQLIAEGVKPLRLGHSARVSEDLRSRTVEALMESTVEYRLAFKWQEEARALRDSHHKRVKRSGKGSRGRAGDALTQASRLNADARRALKEARAKVVRRSKVVCSTAAGADTSALGATKFDVVILDEATQAPDPIALAALQRAPVAVLAGDPCQLSPTVVDAQAAALGLGSTLFERAARRFRPEATVLLRVQYRMNAELMKYPSESMYGGRLQADAGVAERRLHDLPGVVADRWRSVPWTWVDTAGAGWEEQVEPETLSTFNTEQARRTTAEVERLLYLGVPAQDIAAITPYSAQVRLLGRMLSAAVDAGLEIGTVDGFQGREKEAVVVDLVRSNAEGQLGFLNDVRRTNVALTRAKRCLVVIGDGSTLGGSPYYANLIAAAEAAGAWESCFAAPAAVDG